MHGGVQGSRTRGAAHFSTQEHLARRGYELLVPDRPGHGESPSAGRPDDAQADGEWVAELLGEGAHLVGHSFGGAVALAAAARRPEATKTLTLIEPGMQAVAIDRWSVLAFTLPLVFAQKLVRSDVKRIAWFAEYMRIPSSLGGAAVGPEEAMAMGKAMKTLVPPSRRDLLRHLQLVRDRPIPLMVVTGGWSRGIDATADEVARLGGGRRTTIASPHHFPHLVSETFNDRLVEFMSSVPTAHA